MNSKYYEIFGTHISCYSFYEMLVLTSERTMKLRLKCLGGKMK